MLESLPVRTLWGIGESGTAAFRIHGREIREIPAGSRSMAASRLKNQPHGRVVFRGWLIRTLHEEPSHSVGQRKAGRALIVHTFFAERLSQMLRRAAEFGPGSVRVRPSKPRVSP